jgi:phosphatidylserine synthase
VSYLYLPFILQGIVMSIDESIHKKRGLGLWERMGHPLDSLTVFVSLSFLALNKVSEDNMTIYVFLCLFSCLFITKDEFIHSKECSAFENWLHAVLFILHPMIFIASGILWKYYPTDEFLSVQPIVVGIFMIYQLCRWSIPWKEFSR